MTSPERRFGLSCALTIPFEDDYAVALERLVRHVRWCLDGGCASVTAFGTTGEGASLGMTAREQVLGALMSAGIEPRQIVGGVAAASLEEVVSQARMLLDANCRALLLAPPFYFKGVSDDGLFAWFAAVFEALGPRARDVLLYNIPSVTQVALSVDLIGRLRSAFPNIIAGVKDSSGDWAYTERLLAAHRDITILIGDERSLAAAVRLGAEGAISGLANVCPGALQPMIRDGIADDGVSRLVDEVLAYPVTPAVKALVAHRTGDPAWLTVRPPLTPIGAAEAARLSGAYDAIFTAQAA